MRTEYLMTPTVVAKDGKSSLYYLIVNPGFLLLSLVVNVKSINTEMKPSDGKSAKVFREEDF